MLKALNGLYRLDPKITVFYKKTPIDKKGTVKHYSLT